MKVSIPKEEIERIKKQFECDEDKAIKAYLNADEISKKSFDEELSRQLGPKKESDKWLLPHLTPLQIKEHLDKYVIGQEEYKRRLSISAAFHFAILHYLDEKEDEAEVNRFRKKNTIIAGPSGSGKTYSIEVLGDFLEVPTLIVDATDYTESGYVGKSADDMVRELIDMAPGNTRQEKANFINRYGGIIFVDEIDKKARDKNSVGHDISREGFLRAILKLIERKLVSIENPYSPASQFKDAFKTQGPGGKKQKNMISTEKVLFIVGGSFQRQHHDLESIVKDRFRHQGGRIKEDGSFTVLGFKDPLEKNKIQPLDNYYKEANTDDYMRFGLIPELVGRIPIRSYVNLLSKNDLVRIMRDTKDSIIQQYIQEFGSFGIDLSIEDSAIEYVAGLSENKKTGARALVSEWESILTDFQFELPGSNFKELVVDEELCKAPKDAILKLLKRSPFVDYAETFKNEYGVDLIFSTDSQAYIETYASEKKIQVFDALKELLKEASALNYMNIKGKYKVTRKMLKDKKYFDNMFTKWHQKRDKDSKKE